LGKLAIGKLLTCCGLAIGKSPVCYGLVVYVVDLLATQWGSCQLIMDLLWGSYRETDVMDFGLISAVAVTKNKKLAWKTVT